MRIEVEIRPSESEKVPKYVKCLEDIIVRGEEISLEQGLAEWEKQITTRRLTWLENNKDCLTNLEGTEVRKGFELILIQMGIPCQEMPIIEETETKITWHAYDFCPYLEAINKLGMDTKNICKHVTESPVQALLNVLNPNLHYSRNYEKIRPSSEYCEETIELID